MHSINKKMKLLFVALIIVGYLGKSEASTKLNPLTSTSWKATLLVFSGRLDPEWKIKSEDGQVYEQIGKLFTSARESKLLYEPDRIPSMLGYKGFMLESGEEKAQFLILGDGTKELQNALLQSIPKDLIHKDRMINISAAIQHGGILPAKIIDDQQLQKSRTKRWAPIFNSYTLSYWNEANRMWNNNCYNYANDKVTNSFAQPGRGTPNALTPYAPLTGALVVAAATSDGLARVAPPALGPVGIAHIPEHYQRHLVALVVASDDYHWYRLDSDGTWSHKPGHGRVMKSDHNAAVITDPRWAGNNFFGPYYGFVCFMITNKHTITIT